MEVRTPPAEIAALIAAVKRNIHHDSPVLPANTNAGEPWRAPDYIKLGDRYISWEKWMSE